MFVFPKLSKGVLIICFSFFSGKKVKPKGNSLLELDNVVSSQSLMTLKPDPVLPQESTFPSLSSLVFPESAPCLNLQEHLLPSPRHLTGKQTKDVSSFLVAECSQPRSSSHNISEIANLELSTIDWEGTSFSNSPAVQRNSLSQVLQSELESSSILPGFENTPEQCTTNNEVLGRDLQKISPEEHLLSGITGLYLQDLPLKERIHLKSSCPQYNVQTDTNLESLPLKVKSSCITDCSSGCLSNFSKKFPGIYLHKESKNLKVLDNQFLQENSTVNTSIPYSFNDKAVETSSLQVGHPNTAAPYNPKVDEKTTKNLVKKSVCLKRDSSDEESSPVSWKTKYTAPKMKHSSQKHSLAQVRDKPRNPKVDTKETKPCTKSYTTAEDEENSFSDPAKRTQSFLQYHKKDEDSAACLESPLPLCQRLKLRFQNT